MSKTRERFEIARHNDRRYKAPEPWNEWDDYAGCWVCNRCGAAAGYQIHNFNCEHQAVELANARRDELRGLAEDLAVSLGIPKPSWCDDDGRFKP